MSAVWRNLAISVVIAVIAGVLFHWLTRPQDPAAAVGLSRPLYRYATARNYGQVADDPAKDAAIRRTHLPFYILPRERAVYRESRRWLMKGAN